MRGLGYYREYVTGPSDHTSDGIPELTAVDD